MGIRYAYFLKRWGCKKIIEDEATNEKINQCEHLFTLDHISKDIFIEVEKSLLPLNPDTKKLMIETKGGIVVATYSLEDFFLLLEIGKRAVVSDRRQENQSKNQKSVTGLSRVAQDILGSIKKKYTSISPNL
jgi:hypothetical protein